MEYIKYKQLLDLARNSDVDTFSNFFEYEVCDISVRDKSKAFLEAAKAKNTDVVEFLIKKDIDVNFDDGTGSAIFAAANNNDVKTFNIIFKDDEVKTKGLVKYLTLFNKPQMLGFVVNKGLDVNEKDINGNTPIQYANVVDTARILKENGADLKVKDSLGNSLLHRALNREQASELVDFYLASGVGKFIKNNKGETYLETVIRMLAENEYKQNLPPLHKQALQKIITNEKARKNPPRQEQVSLLDLIEKENNI